MKSKARQAVAAKDDGLDEYIQIIRRCMQQDLNVLLSGVHGVGKTEIIREEAKRQGLVVKSYSSPTLDPWADFVGIPVPVNAEGLVDGAQSKRLDFVRPWDIEAAQLVFLDEFNRSHPKVQNATMEMIQFKTINGSPLPNLRMVWAAINPPDDIYAVGELDPVLVDRFHVHLPIPARPSVAYFRDKAGIPEHVSKALVKWWRHDLNDDLKQMISPRRLEYIGQNHINGIDLRYCLPPSVKAPLPALVRRIDGQSLLPFAITASNLRSRQHEILSEMADNVDVMLAVSERLQRWPHVIAQCFSLWLAMTSEIQVTLLRNDTIKTALVNLGRQGRHGDQKLRPLADRLTAIGISLR